MGTSEDHEGFARAEKAWKAFVSDNARLQAVRERIAALEAKSAGISAGAETSADKEARELLKGLRGWKALFEANGVEGEAGREGMACEGGCVGGPCVIATPRLAQIELAKFVAAGKE